LHRCIALAGFFYLDAWAISDRYDYDASGRLIRWVDDAGQATEYAYDAAGNLLRVQVAPHPVALSLSSVAPAAVRRGVTGNVLLTGTALAGARLSIPDSRLSISGFAATADAVTFRLDVDSMAELGPHGFVLENALGQVRFSIRVDPALPRVSITPLPLALPPDGVERGFSVTLSNADSIDHSVALAIADATVASVNPTTLTVPAGQTQATARITGYRTGITALSLSAEGLAGASVPVFVAGDFVGANTSTSPLLGVMLPTETPSQIGRPVSPVASPALGVVRGTALLSLSPDALVQGGEPVDLRITGSGLGQVSGVQLVPGNGLTLGPVVPRLDGSGLTVPVTVSADAPLGWRQVVLAGPAGPYRPGAPGADRLLIAPPPPRIDSIEPLFARPGETVTLTVRGQNFRQASRIEFSPNGQLLAGNPPAVNADGSELAVGVSLGVLAAAGPRVVRVVTPGGITTVDTGPENTFTVVERIQGAVTPVTAPSVGVRKEAPAAPKSPEVRLDAPLLGVALGPVVSGIAPNAASIGSTISLAIEGGNLGGLTGIAFVPPDGLTAEALIAEAGGQRATAELTIAPDAPRTTRRVSVQAGNSTIPIRATEATTFAVTAAQPVLDSIDPLYVVAGEQPVTLTLRGRNFPNGSFVRALPGAGISIGWPPTVNADGTMATVSLAAAADAAPGSRVVTLEAPGGGTGSLATEANTLIVLAQPPKSKVTPLVATTVGVLKEIPANPMPTLVASLVSPGLGVVLPSPGTPTTPSRAAYSPSLGVVLGPVATDSIPPYLSPGASGSLAIKGHGLDIVASARLVGPAGLTLGLPVPEVSGTSLALPIDVDPSAPPGGRRIVLLDAAARPIPFADPKQAQIQVAAGSPRIDSIEPILAKQGNVVNLTIRGLNLAAGRVTIAPSDGLSFAPLAAANAAGTELKTRFLVSDDAPPGARVIRVETPGGMTSGDSSPANTFSVFPQ
jgi:YD repeat-containing protein